MPHFEALFGKSKTELIRMILERDDIQIPVSIFSNSPPLESLVKFLKDNKSMDVKEISFRLNRSKTTIWTTYYNSTKISIDTSSKMTVPLSIFSKKKHSAMECLVNYLHIFRNMKLSEIALLLKRDQRTIWTFNNRYAMKEGTKMRETLREQK